MFIDDVDDDDDDDDDTKAELPVHIVLGASNFSKIKTNMPARTRKTGEAVAELTKSGWMIILTGKENHSNVYLTQSTTHNYEQLFWLDVLGLVDTSVGDQKIVYTEFQEQLQRSTQCWYHWVSMESKPLSLAQQQEWKPCPFI